MNENKISLLILFGGASGEHEVSLSSASSIMRNIDRNKYELTSVGITKDGKWFLSESDPDLIEKNEWKKDDSPEAFLSPNVGSPLYIIKNGEIVKKKIDVVFPALHGDYCEDGTLQGLLELTKIPFVGPGCLSSALAMDKAMTKLVLKNYGIPQAKSILALKSEVTNHFDRIKKTVAMLGYPVFVKPSAGGSSIGISKVASEDELEDALNKALAYCPRVLIEEYIPGKEVEVAVMGNSSPFSSLPGEIAPGSEFYDYDTKYKNDTAEYFIPARISAEDMALIREYAVRIYRALDCKGLSRVDFFVGEKGIRFNEINTLPGFTSISMYPKLMEKTGLSYPEIIDKLIYFAMND